MKLKLIIGYCLASGFLVSGFVFGQNQEEFVTYSDQTHSIKLIYPKQWFVYEEHQGDIHQFYFSKEKIAKESDIFETGITVSKFYNADKLFKGIIPGNPEATRRNWVEMTGQNMKSSGRLLSERYEPITLGGDDALLAEFSFKNVFGKEETEFEVVVFKSNTIARLLIEAPIKEFDAYREMFKKIISEASLFYTANPAEESYWKANDYLAKKMFKEAIVEYNKAIESKPDSAVLYYNRGLCYLELRDYNQTLADETQAIKLSPGLVDAYVSRGKAYGKMGNYDAAIGDFNAAIQLDPKFAVAYYNRGLRYQRKQELDRAISDYSKAIEVDPKYADAYFNRGLLSGQKAAYDSAISDLTKVIEIDPAAADAYWNRSIAYFYKNAFEKSWEDVHKAEALGYKGNPSFLEKLKNASGKDQ